MALGVGEDAGIECCVVKTQQLEDGSAGILTLSLLPLGGFATIRFNFS